MKDLIFAGLDIPMIDKVESMKWLKSLEDSFWFWDDFRQCHMLPLMTKNGKFLRRDAEHHGNLKEQFFWTEFVPKFIRDYFDDHIFPWIQSEARIIVIRTAPGKELPIHIDCAPDVVEKIQHKFRIVVQGQTDNLFFRTSAGDVWAPKIDRPFIMDGSWPHGMINDSDESKYTICLGSPWSGSDNYPDFLSVIKSNGNDLPVREKSYFNPRYGEESDSK